jgi:hypothetical protein
VTVDEHVAQAEHLLGKASEILAVYGGRVDAMTDDEPGTVEARQAVWLEGVEQASPAIAMAQVHATLAVALKPPPAYGWKKP